MSDAPRIGTPEYFGRLHEVEERHWWSAGMRDIAGNLLDRAFPGRKDLRILDAGCGTGILLSWLRAYGRDGAIDGIDVSEDALDFCRKRGHARVRAATALDLPFPDTSFDLVVCNDVVQHLPDGGGDARAFAEFHRVLAPGGCLLVRTNSRCGLREGQPSGTGDYRMYAIRDLERLAQGAGFEVDRASHVNMLMSLRPIAQRYVRFRRRERYEDQGLRIRLLPPALAPVNAALRILLRAEGLLVARLGARLPFGNTIMMLARKPRTTA